MFLEKVFAGKNDIGRWIAMIILVLVFTQIVGAVPLLIAISLSIAANPDFEPNLENPMDLSVYGFSQVETLLLMIIPFIVGIAALYFLLKPIHARPALSMITAKEKFRWRRFFSGAGIWLVLMAGYSVVAIATGLQKVELQFDIKAFIPLVVTSIILLPFQTGFEEFFFRGYLMQGIANIFRNRWMPLLLTSLLFGGLHYFNPEVKAFGAAIMLPQYIWFGMVFGICAIMDDGLEIAWGAHTVNNIFLSIFFTQESSAFQTPAVFNITDFDPLTDFIGLILISAIFIYILQKTYKWPKWNYLWGKLKPPDKQEDEEQYFEEDEYLFDEQ